MIAVRGVAILGVMGLAIAGCGGTKSYSTVDGLLGALEAVGLRFEERGTVPMPDGKHFRFDEGVRVSGPGLWVEIIRIDDPKVFEIAEGGAAFLALAEASSGREFPGKPEVYARQPFLVVVREEPEAGHVAGLLERVLPAGDA